MKNEEKIGPVLMKLGFSMANAAPSTMGTLIGLTIIKAGESVKDKKELEIEDMPKLIKASISIVEQRGKAKKGEKIFLDVLYPVLENIEDTLRNGETDIIEVIKSAYDGAIKGVEQTKK